MGAGWWHAFSVSDVHPTNIARLLLHTETTDGSVIPVWEEVRNEDVAVLKDVMASRQTAFDGVELYHSRIPITAERPPDPSDLNDLIDLVVRTDSSNTPIVVNCQVRFSMLSRGNLYIITYSPAWTRKKHIDFGMSCAHKYSRLVAHIMYVDYSHIDSAMVGDQPIITDA